MGKEEEVVRRRTCEHEAMYDVGSPMLGAHETSRTQSVCLSSVSSTAHSRSCSLTKKTQTAGQLAFRRARLVRSSRRLPPSQFLFPSLDAKKKMKQRRTSTPKS